MEVAMAKSQELSVQQKKELAPKEEKTVPTRYYVPNTDIYETDETLTLVMRCPASRRRT
jgi:HSP20 family protein